MKFPILLFLLVALLQPGRAQDPKSNERTSATLQGDAAHPPAAHWLRSELYFGVGRADLAGGGISETDWRKFLDEEVSSRFPDGLTVFEAYGQWRSPRQTAPERLRSKVLVILHEDSSAKKALIDEIRTAWKNRTHDQSVLLVTIPADVSF